MKITWRKWHRGMAISMGSIFMVWIISGVVMVLPQLRVSSLASAQVEFHPQSFIDSSVSPGDAIKAVNRMHREAVEVTNVQLRSVGAGFFYEVSVGQGRSFLVDARTGEVVTVTEQMARAIAQTMIVAGVGIESSTLVNAYGDEYRSGPLPVYRLEMTDAHGSIIYVSANNGASRYTNRWLRIREAIEGFHSFDPVEWATGSSILRKCLLLLGGVSGGVFALTGFALVRRKM